ncbi:MAG: PAC2 family protein [Candidatus Hadarchaeales archaeon]
MTRINLVSTPRLKNSLMVVGLPGIGNIGKVSVEYLIYKLKGKLFAEMYSEHLPEWTVLEDGRLKSLKINFYHARPPGADMDMVMLTADAQASAPVGQYVLTGEILEMARKFGIETVGAMAAYVVPPRERWSGVVGAASDSKWRKTLETHGIRLLDGGTIVGMNGLLPAMAPLYGMGGFCLLGATRGEIVDIRASRAVLTSLCEMLGFELDMEELTQYSDVGRLRALIPPPGAGPEEEPGYIR